MSVNSEVHFGEIWSESSSEGCSKSPKASFCSASEDFQSYEDSAWPIATEEEATQYAEQIAVEEEEPVRTYFSVDLLTRQIYQTGILICFLHFDSFCFYQCVYFCEKS